MTQVGHWTFPSSENELRGHNGKHCGIAQASSKSVEV
jgi:hypothetical protein